MGTHWLRSGGFRRCHVVSPPQIDRPGLASEALSGDDGLKICPSAP